MPWEPGSLGEAPRGRVIGAGPQSHPPPSGSQNAFSCEEAFRLSAAAAAAAATPSRQLRFTSTRSHPPAAARQILARVRVEGFRAAAAEAGSLGPSYVGYLTRPGFRWQAADPSPEQDGGPRCNGQAESPGRASPRRRCGARRFGSHRRESVTDRRRAATSR